MKLRNKKTGKIVEFKTPACMVDEKYSYQYDSLAELNAEWEDAPERKGITSIGTIGSSVHIEFNSDKEARQFEQKIKDLKLLFWG